MEMTCEICKREGKETKIPYDEIGVELMKAHLLEAHGIRGGL